MKPYLLLLALVLAGCAHASPPEQLSFKSKPPVITDKTIFFEYCYGKSGTVCEKVTIGDIKFLHYLEKKVKP